MTEPKHSLSKGLRLSGLSLSEFEIRYLMLGGTSSLEDLCRHIDDESPDACLGEHDHNVIAQALNEVSLERGHDHPVGYRNLFRA